MLVGNAATGSAMLSALRSIVLVLLTLAVCAAQAAAFGTGGSAGTAQLSTPAGVQDPLRL